MTDGSDLLAAILANPDDDNVRLVYADWLQENGDEARAEYIRLRILRDGDRDADIRAVDLWYANVRQWEPLRGANGEALGSWYRGFIRDIEDTAGWWLAHADEILSRHPVRRVRFTTEPDAITTFELHRQWPGIEFEMPTTRGAFDAIIGSLLAPGAH